MLLARIVVLLFGTIRDRLGMPTRLQQIGADLEITHHADDKANIPGPATKQTERSAQFALYPLRVMGDFLRFHCRLAKHVSPKNIVWLA